MHACTGSRQARSTEWRTTTHSNNCLSSGSAGFSNTLLIPCNKDDATQLWTYDPALQTDSSMFLFNNYGVIETGDADTLPILDHKWEYNPQTKTLTTSATYPSCLYVSSASLPKGPPVYPVYLHLTNGSAPEGKCGDDQSQWAFKNPSIMENTTTVESAV